MFDRRRFLLGSLAGLAAACGGSPGARPPAPGSAPGPAPTPAPAKPTPRKILILGGTGFLGPHLVEAARARGHVVTLFNRGKTHPGLFPDVEKLHGDRDGQLDALNGRTWDAVIDTSGYVPRIVKMSAELLAPSVGHYVFISTISVYKRGDIVGADETAELETVDDPTTEEVPKYYGALKALCEQAAEAAMPGKVANLRPGLIVGPLDPTGRFTHWPTRMADGGEVLCPGDGSTPTQVIDARDLAAWVIRVIEDRTVGVFNALGPARRMTMREMLDDCNAAAGGRAKLTWVDATFLDEQKVTPWADLPAWIDASGEMAGFGTMSNARAVKAGLTFRPIKDTAKDLLDWIAGPEFQAWLAELPPPRRASVTSSGISRDREAAVLAAWHART